MPSPGYRVSGKEVEVHDSGSRHHPLCGRCDLQLIQSHVAPSHGPPARVFSPLFFPAKSLLLPKPSGKKKHFKTSWSSYSLQNCVAPYFLRSRVVYSFLPQNFVVLLLLWLPCLGLNPSTHLPLQPHFRLLLQSATPSSIPVIFQLYWAAIVSLGRCGPMAWSHSSPSSHTGPVTRGSCFPDPSWVEVTPISLAQSRATAISHIHETS